MASYLQSAWRGADFGTENSISLDEDFIREITAEHYSAEVELVSYFLFKK